MVLSTQWWRRVHKGTGTHFSIVRMLNHNNKRRRSERPIFLLSAVLLTACFILATPPLAAERVVRLETATAYQVPADKAWIFKNFKPYSAQSGGGTADSTVKGSVAFGKDQVVIGGTSEIVVKRRNLPFTVKAGSTIEVLDSRGEATALEIDV
jgi:hypothetical protein